VPLSVAFCAAADAGLKATRTVQLAPGASEALQIFNCSNDVGLVPVTEMDVRATVPVPVLVAVTGCASLAAPETVFGKVRDVRLSVINVDAAPVPLNVTFCGDPVALLATLSVAVSVPIVAGLKVTEMVQLVPAVKVDPHEVVLLNALALAPLMAMPPLAMSSVIVPVFFRVTTWAALAVPSFVLAKVRLLGVKVTVGGTISALQALTRLYALTEPSPVVRSYPTVEL